MKVLVTGASGFIGSRLAGRLISEGDEVYGIIHEKPNTVDGMHVITADLSDSTFDIPDVNFDVVYHLAAATALVKDKKKQKKINLEGTINLFDKISVESGEKIPLPHEVRQWAVSKMLDCGDKWEIRFSDLYSILTNAIGRDMLKESIRIQQVRDIYGIRAVDEIRNDLNIS